MNAIKRATYVGDLELASHAVNRRGTRHLKSSLVKLGRTAALDPVVVSSTLEVGVRSSRVRGRF